MAGFDKPQRTRVLEREVQKGTHEKIQGGYGKYQGKSRLSLSSPPPPLSLPLPLINLFPKPPYTQASYLEFSHLSIFTPSGTWVPFDRGVELSKQYGVDHLLAPIIDYQASAHDSPPLAPKHLTAPSSRAKLTKAAIAARASAASPSSKLALGAGRKTNNSRSNIDSESDKSYGLTPLREGTSSTGNWPGHSKLSRSQSGTYPHTNVITTAPDVAHPADDLSEVHRSVLNPKVQDQSSTRPTANDISRTPTPVEERPPVQTSIEDQSNHSKGKTRDSRAREDEVEDTHARSAKRKYEDESLHDEGFHEGVDGAYLDENLNSPTSSKYARAILNYFVSESGQIPDFLVHPPSDFDPNVVIDDDGHTALHWACAMGRIKIIKLLLACGAEIFRANHVGQTALMRAVMFTNNYDLRKFPELFESFHQSTINIDRNDRTVFHYVVDIALQKGKIHAARYYLETILNRLSDYPKELADILNFQDDDGETALTLAARSRSKRLVKILLEHGANPKIANREGKSAEDYMLADEKFRGLSPASYFTNPAGMDLNSSDTQSSMLNGIPPPLEPDPCPTNPLLLGLSGHSLRPQISQTGQRVVNQALPQMIEMIESLASSFDTALHEKERDLNQANGLLTGIQNELAEGEKKLTNMKALLSEFTQKKSEQATLEIKLNEKMCKRYRFGWEKYFRDEEEREKRFTEQQQSLVQQSRSFSHATDPSSLAHRQSLTPSLRELEEQNTDLTNLLTMPNDIDRECDQVRSNLADLREERMELFREFINLSSENVPSEDGGDGNASATRLNDYRRLISLGCGGIELDEVDEVIESLSEGLEFPVSDLLTNAPQEASAARIE